MKEYLGWVQGSDMASTYIHLSGRNMDDALLRVNGTKLDDKTELKNISVKRCPKCGADLTLSPQEIEARDKIFKFFYETYENHKNEWEPKEKYNGFVLERNHFDDWLSRNAVTFSLFVGNSLLKRGDKGGDKSSMVEKPARNHEKEDNRSLERRVAELEKKLEKLKGL